MQGDIKDLLAPDFGIDGRCFGAPHQLHSLEAGLSYGQVGITVSMMTLVCQPAREQDRAAGGEQLFLLALRHLGSPSLKEKLQLIFPAYFLDLLC